MQALLGRTMLIVAHPDDETGTASILLQRTSDAMVVYCTDGAPDDRWFWHRYGSREAYAALRRREALEALSVIGVKGVSFLSNSSPTDFRDQALHNSLPTAINLLERLVNWYEPDAIVTSAYEGGHPDHDSCSFISSVLRIETGVPVWEVPLYHRDAKGDLRCQSFADSDGSELKLVPSETELVKKRAMIRAYQSQSDLDIFTSCPVEYLRLQKVYDYTRPPSQTINYETWAWKVSATEVCARFQEVLRTRKLVNPALDLTLPTPAESSAASGAV